MRRILCLLLVLVMMCSVCVQAFADGDVLYCRMCGKQIPTDSRVCPYCGEKVVHVTDTASAPTPADNKTGSSLLSDLAAAIPPLPAPSPAPETLWHGSRRTGFRALSPYPEKRQLAILRRCSSRCRRTRSFSIRSAGKRDSACTTGSVRSVCFGPQRRTVSSDATI